MTRQKISRSKADSSPVFVQVLIRCNTSRMSCVALRCQGAIFIAIIAVVPSIFFYFTNNTLIQAFGGTSILIMIGVALDTMSKIESQLKMYNYDGFFK